MSAPAELERGETGARKRFPRLVPLLAGWGVTPDMVSYTGVACALLSALAVAIGAGHVLPFEASPGPASFVPWVAFGLMLLAGLLDLLDGDLARGSAQGTAFGGVLDSTLDRFSDVLVLGGGALYFASAGNVTMVAVCVVAITWSSQVSYVKARAEAVIPGLAVGFWQRGERWVVLLFGAAVGHLAAALFVLAIFPAWTVRRRMREARAQIQGTRLPAPSRLAVWREPRGSLGYNSVCALLSAGILVGPWLTPLLAGRWDPLGALLRGIYSSSASISSSG